MIGPLSTLSNNQKSIHNMASIDNKRDVEQTIYGGGHFPDELPARNALPAASRWRRLRSFFTFSPSSYNFIHTPDGQARIRRIVMIIILVLRSGMSALSIISAVVNGNVAGIVIYSLLAVLSLWFTATCLAIIGDAAGNRNYAGHIIVSDTRLIQLYRRKAFVTNNYRRNGGILTLSSVSVCSYMQDLSLPGVLVSLAGAWKSRELECGSPFSVLHSSQVGNLGLIQRCGLLDTSVHPERGSISRAKSLPTHTYYIFSVMRRRETWDKHRRYIRSNMASLGLAQDLRNGNLLCC